MASSQRSASPSLLDSPSPPASPTLPSGFHGDTNNASSYHGDTNNASSYHEDINSVSNIHGDTNNVSIVHGDYNNSASFHEDTSGYHGDSNDAPGNHRNTNSALVYLEDAFNASSYHGESNSAANYHVEQAPSYPDAHYAEDSSMSNQFSSEATNPPGVDDYNRMSNHINEDSNSVPSAVEDSSSSVNSVQRANEDSSQALTVLVNEDSNNALDVDSVSGLSAGSKQVGRRSVSPGEQPPAKVRKLSNSSEDGDGESCPVCLEPWGNAGDHRLVALKCGHLFGAKCVERWLKARPARDRSCPTCKSRASLRDLRFIYARRLVATDTAELSALQKKVVELEAERHRTESKLFQSQLTARSCIAQLEALRSSSRPLSTPAGRGRRTWRFALEKNLEIAREGGCRVLAYNSRSYELYVSQKSTSALFPGWGVRKVSCVDYKPGQFQLIHQKPIRDAAYSASKDQLITVGLDGCIKSSSRGTVCLSIQGESPLWACAWDCVREHHVYAGGVGGTVLHYDIRDTRRPLSRLSTPGQTAPVLSLQSTPSGLLTCRLDSCSIWTPNVEGWMQKPLPVEGPFMSMSYNAESRHVVVSSRPRAGQRGRLVVCALRDDGDCELVQSFPNSLRASVLCRATWVSADDQLWAAAHVESDEALRLYSMEGPGSLSLPAKEPALDVLSTNMLGASLLAALSENRLRIYKAVATDL